jgi:DNA helicase IV
MALAYDLPITPSKAVRASEWPIEIVADVTDAVRRDLALESPGTLAVIVPEDRIDALYRTLSDEFGNAVGLGAVGLTRDVAVITPQEAKGLEFDGVIVVDPLAVLNGSERGAGALYVAMTRATQRLYLVADGELPRGILQ